MTIIMFFEFVMGLTDIYVAGRIGKEIQAAYGFVVQIYFVFIIIANALTVGTVSMASRMFAGGEGERFREVVSTAILLTFGAGFLFSLLGFLLTPYCIRLFAIPETVKPLAIPLGRIYAGGLLFHYLLVNTNGILRASGRVRLSLRSMAVACVLNVILSFFLVFHTPLGYLGIAVSTAASVTVGSLLNLRHLKEAFRQGWRFSVGHARTMVSIGWPAGAGQISWQAHSMVLFLILSAIPVNGVEVLAAFAAGLRVESAIFLPALAFNMGNAVVVGNLIGEGRRDDAFRAGLVTAMSGAGLVTALTAAVISGASFIMPLLSTSGVVVEEGIRYLYVSMLSEPFMAFWLILAGGLMGAGDTKSVMLRVVFATWLVRIPLCFTTVVLLGLGPSAAWWSLNASQFVCTILITRRYLGREWLGPVPAER